MRSECSRCGCSAERDKWGDRICWCDTCHGGCLPCLASEHIKVHLTRWHVLLTALLTAEGRKSLALHKRHFVRPAAQTHSQKARWLHLHGCGATASTQLRSVLEREAPWKELTLFNQV